MKKTRARSRREHRDASAAAPSTAIYFYGVSRRPVELPPVPGVDPSAGVEACTCGGLACWFSRVDRVAYAERLTENMQNLDWLAEAGVQHQRVVAAIAERTDILPARFGTVFLSRENMLADVRRRSRSLAAALHRIAGSSEWGVKVFAVSPEARPAEAAVSGADYLKKKQAQWQQRARPQPPAELPEMAAALHAAAVASVTASTPVPGQPGLVWQASFLVKRSRTMLFHGVLQRFAKKMGSARIETTGPWPPYSFAGAPEKAAGSGQGKRKPARRSPVRT